MKHLRGIRIFTLSVGLAVSLAIVGHTLNSKDQDRGEMHRADELESMAKHRFENFRGLSPCEGDAWQLLRAARGKLIAIGESDLAVRIRDENLDTALAYAASEGGDAMASRSPEFCQRR